MTAWDDDLLQNPHVAADKRTRVQRMFAAIAPRYDLNNRIHSFWQDQRWRRKATELAQIRPTDVVVDVACGTGDLAMQLSAKKPRLTIGVDFTFRMLQFARAKSQVATRGLPIRWLAGDAQLLPLADESADVISIAFGIRNVQDPLVALREFHRILRPGGRTIILEFSLPDRAILRALYNFYFRRILPLTATLISGDRSGAYRYLPRSVNTFLDRQQMILMMRQAGFAHVEHFPLTFGVCVCYRGVKE